MHFTSPMNRLSYTIGMIGLSTLLLSACMGETGMMNTQQPGQDASIVPPGSDATVTNGDPWAPCTDLKSCCSSADMVCKGDPDNNPICTCSSLWDCPNPKKCSQNKQVPPGGGGTWDCSWSENEYVCEGNPSKPPTGGSGWTCNYDNAKAKWVCKKSTTPNPSNKPGGTTYWKCKVDNQANKLICERQDTPPPPPPAKDAGVKPDTTPPPPPPVKTEKNCADGIDNDGDGKVDCKDEDCPKCPPPPPPTCAPGKECCDGKDNDGDGKIDEGNVCANVQEPCPPGAFQACDCYCGVHRKCAPNGTWGPCKVDGNGTCALAKVISQSQCPWGTYCDYGKCVFGFLISSQCKKHTDCPTGKVCDLGKCITDPYKPCP
jgi:hypothetical protein